MKDSNVKKVASIYKITCLTNRKQYIGWTINGVVRRFHVHFSQAKRKGSNSILHTAIRKYGREAFVIEEIYTTLDFAHAKQMEIHFIKEYNTFYLTGHGYNMTLGGDGTVGHPASEESKRQTSKRMKGVPKSPEQRAKISQSNFGKTYSEETRQKMSLAKKGKPQNPEHVKERAERMKGTKRSEETKQKMQQWWTPEHKAIISKRFKELVRTEEHRKKISEALKGKPHSPEHIEAASRARRGKPASEKQLQALRNRVVSKETRQKMSMARKGIPQSPELIKKRGDALRGRKMTPEQVEANRQAQLNRKSMDPEAKEKMRQKMRESRRLYLEHNESSATKNWVLWHKDEPLPFLVRNIKKWAAERGLRGDSLQKVSKGIRNRDHGYKVWREENCPDTIKQLLTI